MDKVIMPPEIIYLVPDNEHEWLWCEDPAPGIGMEIEDSIKYVRDKAPVTPERLAGIIDEITQRALSQTFSSVYFDFLVNELLKKCEIKEKE